MNQYHLEKCVKIMMEDWDGETSRPFYHYAFAIRKNRILAIGKNNPIMTSAKAYRLAKRFNIEHWQKYPFLHAEADLLLKLDELKAYFVAAQAKPGCQWSYLSHFWCTRLR